MEFETAVPARIRAWLPGRERRLRGPAPGRRVIQLGQGDVGVVTPAHVREAARQAIDAGHTRYEYLRELRVAIAEKLAADNGISADPDTEIIVSAGCHAVLFQIFAAFVEPGDEVICGTPGSYYYGNTTFQGGTPVEVPLRAERAFRLDPDEVAAAITPRTKIIALTTPEAPAGTLQQRADLERIAALAQRHDLLVISDEIYEKINHGITPHVSIASLPGMRTRTITVNGFSKGYAMTGWRVGYAAVPAHLMPAVAQVNALNTIWLNTPAQYAALAALRGPQAPFEANYREYTRKMKILVDGINAIPGLSALFPDATYYCWVNVQALGMTSEAFAAHLLAAENVVVQAGTVFGSGGEGYIRTSCSAPEEEICEGLEALARAVKVMREE
jgi:aspartate/methionine/tyrosine aminotransferase